MLTKVGVCEIPFKVTVDKVRNPLPSIVRVCGAAPAAREAGESLVMTGIGLAGETVKVTAADAPPPGAGFVTTTGFVPAVARSAEVSEIMSWLALTNVAAWEVPLKVTVDEAVNPVP